MLPEMHLKPPAHVWQWLESWPEFRLDWYGAPVDLRAIWYSSWTRPIPFRYFYPPRRNSVNRIFVKGYTVELGGELVDIVELVSEQDMWPARDWMNQ